MSLLNKFTGWAAVALAFAAGVPASAQLVQPLPSQSPGNPVNALSTHLRTLAANPRNLSALLGAGQSAIDVGDPNAAVGFFARAKDIDPRSGTARAGLASALVLLEKPDDALREFGEAVSLGVPESTIAANRGLAYDLRGDNRRAQRDYALALRAAPDDEVTRRYALSLGISGERAQAMALLDPLLRKQDQGAWRARAFILAMNNDVAGANTVARQVMPANLASTMSPFLSRLANLNAADRAHAVNFGTMPSDGQSYAAVQMGDPFRPSANDVKLGDAGDALIPAGAPLGRTTVAAASSTRDQRRRTGREPVAVAAVTPSGVAAPGFSAPAPVVADSRLSRRIGTRIAEIDRTKLPPELRGDYTGVAQITRMTALPPPDPVGGAAVSPPQAPPRPLAGSTAAISGRVATASTPGARSPEPVKSLTSAPVLASTVAPRTPAGPVSVPGGSTVTTPLPSPPKVENDSGVLASRAGFVGPPAAPDSSAAAFEVAPKPAVASVITPRSAAVVANPPPAAVVAPTVTAPTSAAPVSRLASILAGIEPEAESTAVVVPTIAQVRATQKAAARKAAAASEAAAAAQAAKEAKAEQAREAAAAKANPARLWVQVATGNNARGLGPTWHRIRDANAATLKPYAGHSVPFKATNRVLAGPIKTSADARALVAALAKVGVSATTYSSEAGQEVAKLGGK